MNRAHSVLRSLIGEVRFTRDFSDDGKVDAADCTVWRNRLNTAGPLANATVSFGTLDQLDYAAWKSNFGASASGSGSDAVGPENTGPSSVPEPRTLCQLAICGSVAVRARSRAPVRQ